ncbi:flagellar export protein FliJ [Planctomicrobium sp. SH661]|uniref:flagellar export protein FliJ n=1 Tax=Planctomicrobium sp. SH661 TaxID=3448124 RepID=UPI003F5B5A34
MKRFRSSLQKVHEICRQQSRMAELEMARAKSTWMTAQTRVEVAIDELETARRDVNRAMLQARQSTVILGLHQHLGAASDRVTTAQNDCLKAEQVFEVARSKYQSAHSKVERLERLIEKQKEAYRRDMLQEQQQAMDDVAIFRWKQPELMENEVGIHG